MALGLAAAGGGPAPAGTAPDAPGLRLVAAAEEVTVERWDPDAPVYNDLGVYLAPVGGPLDLRVREESGERFDVRQVVPGDGGVAEVRRLPSDTVVSFGEGLRDFFEVTVSTPSGELVDQVTLPFCPVSSFDSARVDNTGPDVQAYPSGCGASEVTEAVVWGIDRGWAASVPGEFGGGWDGGWMEDSPVRSAGADIPDGTYDVRVAIAPRYQRIFAVDPAEAVRSVRVTVTTMGHGDDWEEGEHPADELVGFRSFGAPEGSHAHHGSDARAQVVPQVRDDAHGLPDLAALPAWGLEVHGDETGRDYLVFAATVWNAGPGPLVVEGFREPGSNLMRAVQYFYEHGSRIGSAEAGTLEYDDRDGHDHWHFTDFAQYRLLSDTTSEVVKSGKEAFCLAHTDAVDLTGPGASWRPGSIGLHGACGWSTSLWSRQVLDAGWGDTYTQWTPGQSFDITDVPNGSYAVEVATNPDGRLRERSSENNVALREVRLGGAPGARTVRIGDADPEFDIVCPPGDVPPAAFTDREAVSGAHRANVDCAAWRQIVQGLADGRYGPARPVRRDQMASFIARMLEAAGVTLPTPSGGRFTDLVAGTPHEEAILRLAAAEIVRGGPSGLPADSYGPGLRVRRDQMASFLLRAAEYAADRALASDTQAFTDVPAGNPHFGSVNGAAEMGLTQGFGDGTYRPAASVRRDQMATFVIRLLTELVEG